MGLYRSTPTRGRTNHNDKEIHWLQRRRVRPLDERKTVYTPTTTLCHVFNILDNTNRDTKHNSINYIISIGSTTT